MVPTSIFCYRGIGGGRDVNKTSELLRVFWSLDPFTAAFVLSLSWTWTYWLSAPPQTVEWGRLPEKSLPGEWLRTVHSCKPTDSPFHSQENNGIPNWGRFHTMDLGRDRRVSLFCLHTKEQRYLKRIHASNTKAWGSHLPLLLSGVTLFLCSKVSNCHQAKSPKSCKIVNMK